MSVYPWTKTSMDTNAARIAMTVAEAGERDSVMRIVMEETVIDSEESMIEFAECAGRINHYLTIGVNVT